ncbi:MAG: hypothetical protein JSS72_00175 [Armatimonadetes bacterium]|nr:hypothetical protein [Armatimonadota bacterium]
MIKLRPAALLLVAAVGCSKSGPAGETTDPASTAAAKAASDVTFVRPDFQNTGSLFLIHAHDALRVGDNETRCLEVFPQPTKAVEFSELPPQFKVSSYRARGWETSTMSFGTLLYDGKVALAMVQEPRADDERLIAIMSDYQNALGQYFKFIPGTSARYWFWERGHERLVIVAVKPPKRSMRVTIAIGENSLMDALKLDVTDAAKDVASADQLFATQTKG